MCIDTSRFRHLAATLLILAGTAGAAQAQEAGGDLQAAILPGVITENFTGDLPELNKRGVLRALVSYSRTDFFLKGGRPRGIMPDLLREFEKQLNKGRKSRDLYTRIHYVVVPFNRLIPSLIEGKGDVAAAFLTVTPERRKQVDFAVGSKGWVNELLVTNSAVSDITSLDDLSGRSVTVLNGSSYAAHLRELNATLIAAGKPPVDIREADPNLATEDLLELTNAGVIKLTVADHYRAKMWSEVLPNIVVRDDIRVHENGRLGWAVRKGNPELRKALTKFSKKVRKGTLIGNMLMKHYFGTSKWLNNPLEKSERAKLDAVVALFRKYAGQYGFDWLAVAAQAYQESGLDHSAKSRAGAVGIMQILPSTAKDPNVGIPKIDVLENNINAGAKYVAFLRDRYFSDPALDEADRLAFVWAAYNAGPAKVARMRKATRKIGLDPNKWFGNVELMALNMVGQETVRYVGNIYKYYLTYKLLSEAEQARTTGLGATGKTD